MARLEGLTAGYVNDAQWFKRPPVAGRAGRERSEHGLSVVVTRGTMRMMSADDALARGRAAFIREAWSDACRELTAAGAQAPLDPDDLDCLATAAYLVGDDEASTDARARAHAGFLERGDPVRAARSAFWLAFSSPGQAIKPRASRRVARARAAADRRMRPRLRRTGFLLCALGFRAGHRGRRGARARGVRGGCSDRHAGSAIPTSPPLRGTARPAASFA